MLKRYKLQTIFLIIVCVFVAALLLQQRQVDSGTDPDKNISADVEKDTDSEVSANTGADTKTDTGTEVGAGTDADNKADTSDIEALETAVTTEPLPAGSIVNPPVLESDGIDNLFYSTEISEDLIRRIQGISYQENDNISLSELCYLRVLYYGFDGETHIGELIVNQKIEADILEIMKELYENQYPIEKMVLIDEYDADDESSMADNNTSAFNYRTVNGSTKLSKHSLGLAIDINPRFNPCIKTVNGEALVEPANGTAYTDRTQDFPYKITEQDLCYRLFTEHGFTWGGSWNSLKDYQHFEKEL